MCVKGKAKKQKQKTKMGVGVSVSAVFRFFFIFFVGSLSLPVCRLLHFFFSPVLQSNMQMEADESSAPYLRIRDHISLRRGSFKKAEQDEDARRRKKIKMEVQDRSTLLGQWVAVLSLITKRIFPSQGERGGRASLIFFPPMTPPSNPTATSFLRLFIFSLSLAVLIGPKYQRPPSSLPFLLICTSKFGNASLAIAKSYGIQLRSERVEMMNSREYYLIFNQLLYGQM